MVRKHQKPINIALALAALCMLWVTAVALYGCADYPVRFNQIEDTRCIHRFSLISNGPGMTLGTR